MTLHGLIRDTTTQDVREVSSELVDYAAAKPAVVAQVAGGEALLSLRQVERYEGDR